MFFWVVDFLKKTNENKSTWGIIVVKTNSFVRFLEEFMAWQFAFEIIWPLAQFHSLLSTNNIGCIFATHSLTYSNLHHSIKSKEKYSEKEMKKWNEWEWSDVRKKSKSKMSGKLKGSSFHEKTNAILFLWVRTMHTYTYAH